MSFNRIRWSCGQILWCKELAEFFPFASFSENVARASLDDASCPCNNGSASWGFCSAVRDSQQPISPIRFLFLTLLPPPRAALLVLLLEILVMLYCSVLDVPCEITVFLGSHWVEIHCFSRQGLVRFIAIGSCQSRRSRFGSRISQSLPNEKCTDSQTEQQLLFFREFERKQQSQMKTNGAKWTRLTCLVLCKQKWIPLGTNAKLLQGKTCRKQLWNVDLISFPELRDSEIQKKQVPHG